jgi:DNA-binding transcriptional MerR regulator
MTPKLYRAQEVCDLAQVQPYVLRSWEKEFPGIGVQKSDDSPRLYRQADLDQVLLIKRLVFSEGLTLAGARRKLEESAPRTAAEVDHDVAEVLDALASGRADAYRVRARRTPLDSAAALECTGHGGGR